MSLNPILSLNRKIQKLTKDLYILKIALRDVVSYFDHAQDTQWTAVDIARIQEIRELAK